MRELTTKDMLSDFYQLSLHNKFQFRDELFDHLIYVCCGEKNGDKFEVFQQQDDEGNTLLHKLTSDKELFEYVVCYCIHKTVWFTHKDLIAFLSIKNNEGKSPVDLFLEKFSEEALIALLIKQPFASLMRFRPDNYALQSDLISWSSGFYPTVKTESEALTILHQQFEKQKIEFEKKQALTIFASICTFLISSAVLQTPRRTTNKPLLIADRARAGLLLCAKPQSNPTTPVEVETASTVSNNDSLSNNESFSMCDSSDADLCDMSSSAAQSFVTITSP